MNDNEIIKALECCVASNCGDCTIFNNKEIRRVPGRCVQTLEKNALDLINRQQAEIKALTGRTAKQEAAIERLEDVKEQLESDIINANMNLEHMTAEIERLQKENNQFADIGKIYSEIKTEAIKEFAERLKEKAEPDYYGDLFFTHRTLTTL